MPEVVADEIKIKIAAYVANGGGVFIEVPDRGSENINVLGGVEDIYCTSYSAPIYGGSFWTSNGTNHYMFHHSVRLGFLTTLNYDSFSDNWNILMSDIETTFTNTVSNNSTFSAIGSVGAEFSISYCGYMNKGIVIITEDLYSSSSSSIDSSSSSSSSSIDSSSSSSSSR